MRFGTDSAIRSTGRIVILLPAILLTTIFSTGCTVIGLGAGAAIDAARTDTESFRGDQFAEVRSKRVVAITLRDSTRVEGISDGLAPIPPNEYTDLFDRDSLIKRVSPVPGDRVRLVTGQNRLVEGDFIDYDVALKIPRKVPGELSFGEYVPIVCRIETADPGDTVRVPLNQMRSLASADETEWNLKKTRSLGATHKLPLRTGIAVISDEGRQHVKLNDITRIEQTRPKNAKWWLMGLGAAVDFTIIMLAIFSDSLDFGIGGGGGSGTW